MSEHSRIVIIDFGRMRLDLTPVVRMPIGDTEISTEVAGGAMPR